MCEEDSLSLLSLLESSHKQRRPFHPIILTFPTDIFVLINVTDKPFSANKHLDFITWYIFVQKPWLKNGDLLFYILFDF